MILNVQVLRGLAALAVVLYHTDFRIYHNIHTDFQAVSVFFVISGLIMTHIIQNGEKHFLLHRLIRIVPLYWIITLFAFLLHCASLFKTALSNHTSILAAVPLKDVAYLIKSLLFVPFTLGVAQDYFPFLGVGWTLNLEMFFYLLLALTLTLSRKWAAILACCILIGLKFIDASFFYSHSYTTFFVLGVLAYYSWVYIRDFKLMQNKLLLITVAFIVNGYFIVLNLFGYLGGSGYLTYLMPFGVVLVALFLDSAGIHCKWKPMLALGNASYALYLVHTIWIGIQMRFVSLIPYLDYKHNIIGALIAISISCLLALFIHYKIEKSILKMLRHKLLNEAPKSGESVSPSLSSSVN